MDLLGPERQRPTVFYSSSFSMWRGLVGSGAGPRWSRRCPLSRSRRAAPRQSGGNPPPHCRQGGASAEPAMSSASLLVGRGLGGVGPPPRCRRGRASVEPAMSSVSLPAGRRLGGAGEILPLIAGRVGPRLSRRCPLPRCWRGRASAEPAVSSASLLAPWGLGGAGPRRRQRSGDSSEPAKSSTSSLVSPNSASLASSASL